MVEAADLVATLRSEGDIKFISVMARAEASMVSLAGKSDSAMSKLTKVGLALGGLAVGAGVYSVKAAAEFETLTTRLVTGAGESEDALDAVRAGLLAMAGEVGESADELARGMYFVESASFHGAAGLEVLRAAAEGAKIGGADQTDVARGLTTALKDYGLSAADAAGVTGQMIAAVAAGKQTMSEFSANIATYLPIAAQLHISFQQIAAAEATMTEYGVPAATAATALRFGLQALLNPTEQAKRAMSDLGVNVAAMRDALASGNLTGVLGMFADAQDRANKAGKNHAITLAALNTAFGGARGAVLGLNLIPHLSDYATNVDAVGTTAQGARKETLGWALVQKDLNQQLEAFNAAIQADAISLGTTLLPQMTAFLHDDLNPVVSAVGDWIRENPTLVSGLEKVGAALAAWKLGTMVVAPLLSMLGLLGKVKDVAAGGKGGGLATAVLNVTAEVVNVNGGIGGAAKGVAAGEAAAGLAVADTTLAAGIVAGVGTAAIVAAPIIAVTAAGGMAYGAYKSDQVEAAITKQAKALHDAQPQDFSAYLQAAHQYYSRPGYAPSAFAIAEPGLQQAYAQNPAQAWQAITINVHPGAVTVHSAGGTTKELGNDMASALADHIVQQFSRAQKSLGSGAKSSLPGAVGGAK